MSEERSGSGAPIHRHEPGTGDRPLVEGDPDLIERVQAVVEATVGPVEDVFHELVSTDVHVDILHCAPTDERPVHTLVTCGMSQRPMRAPEGRKPRAELLVVLPPDWPLDAEAFKDERHYWPVRALKRLARLPHEYDTYLGQGHTVPNDDPPEPYAPGTQLCCALLLPPLTIDGLELDDTEFHGLYFLHAAEMQLKLDRGLEALLDVWDESDDAPMEIVEPGRPSTVAAPRRRGFFRR